MSIIFLAFNVMSFIAAKSEYPVWTLSAVFVVGSIPIVRMTLPGNLPIYLPDILIAMALLQIVVNKSLFQLELESVKPIPFLILLYWIPITILNFSYELVTTGVILEVSYVLVRQVILLSFTFVLVTSIDTNRKLRALVMVLAATMLVSGSIAFLQSNLSVDHPIFITLDEVFPRDLEAQQSEYVNLDTSVRALGLIGDINGLGLVLSTLTIIGMGALLSNQFRSSRVFLTIAVLMAFFGTLVSYSRAAYVELVLGGLVYFMQGRKLNFKYAIYVTALLLIVYYATTNLALFNFVRIDEGFAAISEDTVDFGEEERTEAPAVVYEFLMSNPLHIFVGNGDASNDLVSRGVVARSFYTSPTEVHNIIGTVILRRGLIAGVIFSAIYIFTLIKLNESVPPKLDGTENPHEWLIHTARAVAIALLPMMMSEHAAITVFAVLPYLFFLFGFFMVAYRFAHTESLVNHKSQARTQ